MGHVGVLFFIFLGNFILISIAVIKQLLYSPASGE